MSDPERPLRIGRRLRDAANAHDARVWRVALRAARLRRDGWRLGEAAALGLLDPRLDPAACGWAVRATELEELQAALNPADAVPLAEDKRHFAEVCARHGIPAAAQVAVLERAGGPEASARAWAATLEQETPDGLVIKPVNGYRGLGVRVLERVSGGVADHHGRVTGWDALARELAGEQWPGYVVQERLRPHQELVGMSGHGLVHTLRLMTLRDDGTPARLLGARLRIATGREPVDSFRAGATGNMTAVVLDDGTLGVPVTVRPSGFGLERVPRHPRSGTPLTGFRIPDWEGALDLARRAADAFAPLRAMGWDIAPTPQGPVLIEANAWWTNLPDPGPGPNTMLAALREAASGNGS